ncbi:hypothetical protein BDV38DRAFT_257230 [Aspergillus pseudotamarii]|uniref:Uncharacterized protein n=1 Tax=Aspergillus pseudotamarii TaxID=132259 RepID=A0A5N6SIX9_ASPPS|nr:uncharacterized protein BDV38DRAFT_257230 [Aspergillus pseudotamarii]KAE8133849.1 hypothetical protein BDV38DRAFT_257230 [Aspergillus pseudotamarii]
MGVVESKQLAQNVLVACQRAEIEGKTRLDSSSWDWKDKTIIKAVKSVCRHIPKDIRGPSRESAVKRTVARPLSRVNISQVVQDLVDKRETLFPEIQPVQDAGHTHGPQDSLGTLRPSTSNPGNSLARWYELTVDHERQHDLYKIRLRFLYVMFYRLKQWVEPGSQYQYFSAAEFIAQVILNSGSSSDSLDVVRNRVREWVGHGERYELLAKDLGGLGVLYILPDYGSKSLWTKDVPKSAHKPNRILMLERLKREGIDVEALHRGLHASANAEIDSIFTPLQGLLQIVLEHGLSQAQHSSTPRMQRSEYANGHNAAQHSSHTLERSGVYENQPFPSETNSQPNANQTSRYYQATMPTSHQGVETQGIAQNTAPYGARLSPNGDPILTGMRCSMQQASINRQREHDMDPIISNTSQYNCNMTGADPPTFITMTPTNYPQVFPLPMAATMTPTNHPQVFPHQPASTILPMNYPQVFPFQNLTNPPSCSSQTEQQVLQPGEGVHHPQPSQYFDVSSA